MSTMGLRLAEPALADRGSWRINMLSAIRVTIALLVVANLGRVPLLSTGDREAPLLLNDLGMLFVVALGALSGIASRSFRIDRLTMLALVFAGVGAYAALLAVPRYGLTPWQLVISLAYLARWLAYFGLYVVIINVVRAEELWCCGTHWNRQSLPSPRSAWCRRFSFRILRRWCTPILAW